MNLTQLDAGIKAKVIELQGGHQFTRRIESMGITAGSIVTKKSSSLMRCPIILQKGPMQLAISYGMAGKIVVEPVNE